MQIYKITNLINNKIYIGKDTTSKSDYFGSGLLITRSIDKYGKENFIKEIIDEATNHQELSEKEIYWINKFDSNNLEVGYNITKGGDGGDTLTNHPELSLIKEKISKNNPKTGKTYEEVFGREFSERYKNKIKNNIYNSILSEESIKKNKQRWIEYNQNFRERCDFLKLQIEEGRLYDYLDELKLIKKRVSHNFFKNSEGFYKFFGDNLKFIFGGLKYDRVEEFKKIDNLIYNVDIEGLSIYVKYLPKSIFGSRKDFYYHIGEDFTFKVKTFFNSQRKNSSDITGLKIKINGEKFESIGCASKKLNIDKSLIRYRLKSEYFKDYLYMDNELNLKYNKFGQSKPNLRSSISINGVIYESIAKASKELNKISDYISWRLNSKSYIEWFYTNKKVYLKDTGVQKNKKVNILGKEYCSIADAVRQTGIDRQVMRYRIKSKKFSNYFYI